MPQGRIGCWFEGFCLASDACFLAARLVQSVPNSVQTFPFLSPGTVRGDKWTNNHGSGL
jgi:hypothetical protein